MTNHEPGEADLAAIGYAAYWEAVGGKAVSGADLPKELTDVDLLQVHVGWKAAARAIAEAVRPERTNHAMNVPEALPSVVTCARCGVPLTSRPVGPTQVFVLEDHDCPVLAAALPSQILVTADVPRRTFGVVDPRQDGPAH